MFDVSNVCVRSMKHLFEDMEEDVRSRPFTWECEGREHVNSLDVGEEEYFRFELSNVCAGVARAHHACVCAIHEASL